MKALSLIAIACVAVMAVLFSQEAQRAHVAAQQPSENKAEHTITAALQGCRRLTEARSPIAVKEFVRDYEVVGENGQPKVKPPHYRVGIEYRAGAAGVLMHSTCEYEEAAGALVPVRFAAR